MREYFNVKMCLCFWMLTQHTCVSVSCLGDVIEKGVMFGSFNDSAIFFPL
jgi:hypothetical protein